MSNWKLRENSKVLTFEDASDPIFIHVIKTGFADKYIVVYEDAYEQYIGQTDILSSEELLQKYGIDFALHTNFN